MKSKDSNLKWEIRKRGQSKILAYCTRAIITRGLYVFYPIFQRGLYCRAVYDEEQLIFHDSFFFMQVATKNRIVGYFFVVHTQYFCTKAAVYTTERCVLQDTFL